MSGSGENPNMRVEVNLLVATSVPACISVANPQFMQEHKIPYAVREAAIRLTSGAPVAKAGRYHAKGCELLVRDRAKYGYRMAAIRCEVFLLEQGIKNMAKSHRSGASNRQRRHKKHG
jgi:hypothetical protein